LANINLFTYCRGDSVLHRCHPTLKIVSMILISVLITKGSLFMTLYFLSIVIISYIVSKLKFRLILKDVKYLVLLLVLLLIIQRDPGVYLYILKIGIILAFGTIFTGTTRPNDISPGLYKIFPNKFIARNIGLTINLIPTFIISWQEIEIALKSRGLYLRKNPFRIIIGLGIPLVIQTFKKADTISLAMESRLFTGNYLGDIEAREINPLVIIPSVLPLLLLLKKLLL